MKCVENDLGIAKRTENSLFFKHVLTFFLCFHVSSKNHSTRATVKASQLFFSLSKSIFMNCHAWRHEKLKPHCKLMHAKVQRAIVQLDGLFLCCLLIAAAFCVPHASDENIIKLRKSYVTSTNEKNNH